MSDLELLRTYEPVVRFTKGEMFFPSAVDGFVAHCSLWTRGKDDSARQLVPVGQLTLDKLAEYSEVPLYHTIYLRFVDQPLRAGDFQRWQRRPERVPFRAGGRLARVPIFSRIADSSSICPFLSAALFPGEPAPRPRFATGSSARTTTAASTTVECDVRAAGSSFTTSSSTR